MGLVLFKGRELEPGQGWGWTDGEEEETLICSHHGEAMATYIKASFRSPVWSQWTAERLCGQSGNIKYAAAKRAGDILQIWTMEGLNGQEGGGGGTFGDFCEKHERAFVLGGTQRSEGWLCSPCIYRACMNIWLMSHRLKGNAISERWLYKASRSHTHTHTERHIHHAPV